MQEETENSTTSDKNEGRGVFKTILIVIVVVAIGLAAWSWISGNNAMEEPVEDVEEEVNLVGPVWMWEGTTTPVDTIEVPDPENYTLKLNDDGTAEVKADCNSASGTYEIEGNSISFGPMATTLAFCGEDSLDFQYTQGLASARTWFTQDGKLFFDMEADSGTMRFVAQ